MHKKRGNILIFTVLFINIFCFISMSFISIVMNKHKILKEREQGLLDSDIDKRLESCIEIAKKNIEGVNKEEKVVFENYRDKICFEGNLLKICIHKNSSYYKIFTFEYSKKDKKIKYKSEEVNKC